jgi:hypothetical protein
MREDSRMAESNVPGVGAVACCLTPSVLRGNLKSMRRLIFAALLPIATPLAQAHGQVPGRDLLDFPIGTLAEGSALAGALGDGFRNPATAVLLPGERARFSAGALSSPADIGLTSQSLAVSAAILTDVTATVSIVRAAVEGIFRTATDPQSNGEVPYNTFVVSAGLSRRENSHFSGGVALRYRTGALDMERRNAIGLDGGVVVKVLPELDGRVGASSFLWTPTGSARERMTLNVAGDLRVVGPDSVTEVRSGISWTHTREHTEESALLLSARLRPVEARASVGRITAFGDSRWNARLGLGLHYGRFAVSVVREDSGNDLAVSYQFALTAVMR